MAIARRHARGTQQRLTRLTIGITVLAALVATAPILGALTGLGSQSVRLTTAFASAPSGNYAVVTRNEGLVDVLSVVWAENPSAVTEIARVPHLDGFTSTGAVSPDGRQVALVTVDAGSQVRPGASLLFANLETGELSRAAIDIEPLQTPVWAQDSNHAIVTRLAADGRIDLLKVSPSAEEQLLSSHTEVLGVYPLGFDGDGALLQVLLDGRGSTLQREGVDLTLLSPNITRDWQLSPDGSQVAFIDVETSNGLAFVARVLPVQPTVGFQAQALQAPASALGVAWNPASGSLEYGLEPGESGSGVLIQGQSASSAPVGFDIPLAYSNDGTVLAVTRWNGASFDEPGSPSLQLIDDTERIPLTGFTRFLGWSQR